MITRSEKGGIPHIGNGSQKHFVVGNKRSESIFVFKSFLANINGGIPYTAHGSQIAPPHIFYFSCFYAHFRLGKV